MNRQKIYIKIGILLIPMVFIAICSFGQGLGIDTIAIKNWEVLDKPIISHDGHYFAYIVNCPGSNSNTLIIQSTSGNWRKHFAKVTDVSFSHDSKMIIFLVSGDSLCLLTLGTDDRIFIPKVITYKIPNDSNGKCIAYHSKTSGSALILINLFGKKERSFSNVLDYTFSKNGKYLFFRTECKNGSSKSNALHLVDLLIDRDEIIWQGENLGSYIFDSSGEQLAFLSSKKRDKSSNNLLWYFKVGMDTAIVKVNDGTPGIDQSMVVDNATPKFSKDGTRIFFAIKQLDTIKPNQFTAKVDLWSYADAKLQSQQLTEILNNRVKKNFIAVIGIQEKYVIRLEQENDEIKDLENTDGENFLIVNRIGVSLESNWNESSHAFVSLISTKSGNRTLVKGNITNTTASFVLSPHGKYVIYYDYKERNYFSYNIQKGISKNLTSSIVLSLCDEQIDKPELAQPYDFGKSIWLASDDAFFICDRYDIWKVYPDGIKKPINITNGYGRKNKIVFRLTNKNNVLEPLSTKCPSILLLTAFNSINKYNGFYLIDCNEKKDPELLNMGPFIYNLPSLSPSSFTSSLFPPLKAKYADVCVVRRMSAIEAPNYFLTNDFKSYRQLSFIEPQEKYNWMTTELIKWKTFNGGFSEGILYKPENFEASKKYPIIFHFYETMSDKIYEFLKPQTSNGPIDIPWFVSNGYLVFTPDIHYTIGRPGESAYNSVVSAAKYLSRMPWVDSSRMGIQGHSFGGFEVNYIISRTNLFTAAAEAAGAVDLVSSYNSIRDGQGISAQYHAEVGQGRIGATLWQKQDLYIKNSPIFEAHKITTPLLMMHNKKDEAVAFAQAVEFFTALRRLKKRTWLLQYDDGGHSVGGIDAIDYTIRMAQFFDHYLKHAPAPTWMTKGILAKLKGIETGYAYDPGGNCGKDCKVCKKWNDKYQKDSVATWQEIDRRKRDEHWQ